MRDFNEADRGKKRNRILLPDNPGQLSESSLLQLTKAIKERLEGGYVTCQSAWNIASDSGVSRLDVGVMIDKLGIRLTACQLGCFKVSKRPGTKVPDDNSASSEIAQRIKLLSEAGELTCSAMHDLSCELNVRPILLSDAANAAGYKIRKCQLGCF